MPVKNTEFWLRTRKRAKGDAEDQATGQFNDPLPHPGKGLLWEVRCTDEKCGLIANRTTSQINRDLNRCICRKEKNPVELTHLGVTRTLSSWASIYPNINKQSVWNRLSDRRSDKATTYDNWSDSQVLFGKDGGQVYDNVSTLSKARAEVDGTIKKLSDFICHQVSLKVDELIRERVTPLLIEASKPPDIAPELVYEVLADNFAGKDYVTLDGVNTIGDLVGTSQMDDLLESLRTETFATPEEKRDRLDPYIPVDDRYLYITDLEIMALTPVFTLDDFLRARFIETRNTL